MSEIKNLQPNLPFGNLKKTIEQPYQFSIDKIFIPLQKNQITTMKIYNKSMTETEIYNEFFKSIKNRQLDDKNKSFERLIVVENENYSMHVSGCCLDINSDLDLFFRLLELKQISNEMTLTQLCKLLGKGNPSAVKVHQSIIESLLRLESNSFVITTKNIKFNRFNLFNFWKKGEVIGYSFNPEFLQLMNSGFALKRHDLVTFSSIKGGNSKSLYLHLSDSNNRYNRDGLRSIPISEAAEMAGLENRKDKYKINELLKESLKILKDFEIIGDFSFRKGEIIISKKGTTLDKLLNKPKAKTKEKKIDIMSPDFKAPRPI